MKMKKCPICGIEKPLDEFYKRKSRARGLKKVRNHDQRFSYCKECCKIKSSKRAKALKALKGPTKEKTCSRCGVLKTPQGFYKSSSSKDGYSSFCKRCDRARLPRKPNKKLARFTQRAGCYRRKYNITINDYDEMFKAQEGRCAICGTDSPSAKGDVIHFSIDHDHLTGNIRGLLCDQCNFGLGHFQDNPEFLQKAINYLREREQ